MVLLAACGFSKAFAGTGDDKHCLSDNQTETLLKDYCGIEYSWWNYSYSGDAPTAAKTGDVVFVEVNDYWKGAKTTATSTASFSSLFNQVKYGVKRFVNVTNYVKIPSGTMYNIQSATNRFFFMSRLAKRNTEWDRSYYNMPFSWYEEWSCISNDAATSSSWANLNASYDALKNGEPLQVPHICDNSLELNHYTTLYDKDTKDQTYSLSIFFYLPDGIDKSNYTKVTTHPYAFIYRGNLAGTMEKNDASTAGYASNLNWKTIFDNTNSDVKSTVFFDTKRGGLKEYFTLVRRINGVDEVVASNITDKTFQDVTLPRSTEAYGYEVSYYVICNMVQVDASGNPVKGKSPLATVNSNVVTLQVPGEEGFTLSLNAEYNAEYVNNNAFGENKNHFTNTLSAANTTNIPTLLKDDVITFSRTISDNTTNVQTLKVTNVSKKSYEYTLTTLNSDGTSTETKGTLTTQADLFKKATTYVDNFDAQSGVDADTKYQITLTSGNGVSSKSNYVTVPTYKTPVVSRRCHRSGTPDPKGNPDKEVFRNDIAFSPISDSQVDFYYVWRGNKRVARLSDLENGTYKVDLPNENGIFNIDGGLAKVEANKVVYSDFVADAPINEYEGAMVTSSPLEFDYTVEIHTLKGNTYGNNDTRSVFDGNLSELALNANVTSFRNQNNTNEFRAEITWDVQSPSLDPSKILGYNVYARDYDADLNEVYTKLNTEMLPADARSYSTGTFEFKGYNERVFPKVFYVRAIVEETPLQTDESHMERNSNVASSTFVTTGVNFATTTCAKVVGENGAILISGAQGQNVEVYSCTGSLVEKTTISDDEQSIEVAPGVYMVRMNNAKTFKVQVR